MRSDQPDHDRVELSDAEQTALASLAAELGDAEQEQAVEARFGLRLRAMALLLRTTRFGPPLLFLTGTAVMLLTITVSPFVAFVGALMCALALGQLVSRPWWTRLVASVERWIARGSRPRRRRRVDE